jgi:Mrp family chromosome partitioning ATPase
LAFASGILGLVLGTCIVIFKRFCATTLQSEAEVRVIAGGARMLANIPRRSLHPEPPGSSRSMDSAFMAEGVSASTEAFRMMRANLYQSATMQTGHAILLTSPVPGDGKTLTTLSLAAVLAADQKWVLVIDADLRKPSHHKITGGDDGRGLRTILSGQCSWRDAVKPVSGPFGEFFSIGAGRMAPGELSSERMARFLIDARSRYDFVLIDGPSFPLVADPLVLAPLADEVISVMRLGHTPRAAAEEHVRRLSMVAHGYSVVINDTAPSEHYGVPPKPPSLGWWSRFQRRNVRNSRVPRALPRG